jgi:hypothetical protein
MGWFDESSDDEKHKDNTNDASRENLRRKQIESFPLERGDETKPNQNGTAQHTVAVADEQPQYVQSLQIDDDDNENNHDAHQSKVELGEFPTRLALVSKGGELDKCSTPLEGVPNLNGLEGDSAFLEGEFDEISTALLLGEEEKSPDLSVLLERDELDMGSTLLERDELGPPTATPTEDDEASIPTEHVRNGTNLNRTFTVRRKAAKRILPWDLPVDQIQLASSSPQDEGIRETKRPRLEEPLPATADVATTTKNTSHDTMVAPPPDDCTVAADANADPVTDTQPKQNDGAFRVTRRWTPEEDANLTWRDSLMHSIDGATGRRGKWTEEEDNVLKNAVHTRGDNNWDITATLVLGRTKRQCRDRWNNSLKVSINGATGCFGLWTDEEDSKLRESVQMHDGKDWAAITALVPGRTIIQCGNRWHVSLKHSVDGATRRTGTWTEEENNMLKDLVFTHGDNNWDEIAPLVSGRTIGQCRDRWSDSLKHSINPTTGCFGLWTEDEDINLKDALHTHGDNNWDRIATLVQGRTKRQCRDRWNNSLKHSIEGATGCFGLWTDEEDSKLRESVQMHNGKNWAAITALVPGRTKIQCRNRWHVSLKHSVDGATRRTGKWTEEEDINLKDLVDTYGDNNWDVIAALVSGRTKRQCRDRWHEFRIGS